MLCPGSVFAITGNERATHVMPHTTRVSGVCEMFVIGILLFCFDGCPVGLCPLFD
jgi:hypothetical protein